MAFQIDFRSHISQNSDIERDNPMEKKTLKYLLIVFIVVSAILCCALIYLVVSRKKNKKLVKKFKDLKFNYKNMKKVKSKMIYISSDDDEDDNRDTIELEKEIDDSFLDAYGGEYETFEEFRKSWTCKGKCIDGSMKTKVVNEILFAHVPQGQNFEEADEDCKLFIETFCEYWGGSYYSHDIY